MFTGLVEEAGTVAGLRAGRRGGRLTIRAPRLAKKLKPGASVAVSGVCLTVTARTGGEFACDLSPETLRRTSLGRLEPGARVNLEAPLKRGAPLGGHIVQGHVDGTGTLVALRRAGRGNYWLDVEVPAGLARYLVEKGSMAVEGISLTVAAMNGTRMRAAIIPFTHAHTNLRTLRPGDMVNLECDIVAKYVEKLLGERPGLARAPGAKSRLTLKQLRAAGF